MFTVKIADKSHKEFLSISHVHTIQYSIGGNVISVSGDEMLARPLKTDVNYFIQADGASYAIDASLVGMICVKKAD